MLLTEVTTVISVDLRNTSCEVIYDSNPGLADDCSQTGVERRRRHCRQGDAAGRGGSSARLGS